MKYGLSEKQLDQIIKIISSYQEVEKAILFGSRAIDTYKAASDVDIAIMGEECDLLLAAKIKDHLEEETYLPFFFDIIAYNSIKSPELKEHIQTKGKTLFKRNCEWREVKLGEVTVLNYGKALKAQDRILGEIPVYSSAGITGYHNTPLVNSKGIVVGRKGTIGKIYKTKTPFCCIDTAYYILPDEDTYDFNFLYYLLQTLGLEKLNSDSAVPGLNRNTAYDQIFLLPSLPEQKAIAEILGSLDDKIDLLHRQNKTLEQLAETLFRQWFIEEADENWEDGKLEDIIEFNPVYKMRKGERAPYLEMKNVSTTNFNPENYYYRDFTSGIRFKNKDTIIARITPCLENGKTAFVTFLNENQIGWGSTEYIIMRMKGNYHKFLSYLIAKNNDFRDHAINSMSGSSGRQRAQVNVMKEYEIKIPTDNVINKINVQLDPIVEKMKYNAIQITTLENLRDTLLPKLMSGEIRIKYE